VTKLHFVHEIVMRRRNAGAPAVPATLTVPAA
jgi:hypothetical protein